MAGSLEKIAGIAPGRAGEAAAEADVAVAPPADGPEPVSPPPAAAVQPGQH